MRCGPPSNACVRVAWARCWPGRCVPGACRPTSVRCAGCRSPPTAGARWVSCSASRARRQTLRPPRCASRSKACRRGCACSSAAAAMPRRACCRCRRRATPEVAAMLWACILLPAAESARWRDLLAAWAYQYSSQVATCFDNAVGPESAASLGLFGPWPLFERRLRADLEALGVAHRIAVAPNARAAWVLAGMHDGVAIVHEATLDTALKRIPVSRARLDHDTNNPAHARALRSAV